jgi:hypothetical protein
LVGGAATISVVKAASGVPLSSGTVLHSGAFNANSNAGADQGLTVTTSSLANGDRLGLISAGGNFVSGGGVGVITVFIQ